MEQEFESIKEFLEEKGIAYEAYRHRHVHTSEEASETRGVPMHSGVKSMVVKSENGFFLVLLPGDRRMDFGKLAGKIGKAKLAGAEEVFRVTGCEIGSVHPFGNLLGLPVIMDRHVLDNKTVHFSAGTHTDSISMDPKDMVKIIGPAIGDFSR